MDTSKTPPFTIKFLIVILVILAHQGLIFGLAIGAGYFVTIPYLSTILPISTQSFQIIKFFTTTIFLELFLFLHF